MSFSTRSPALPHEMLTNDNSGIGRSSRSSSKWRLNYSENKGKLELMEAKGIVRRTGRIVQQMFVEVELVEVLVPEGELIRNCGKCDVWEEVDGGERFKRCTRCMMRYYCSKKCQEDWEEHKKLCKKGLAEEEVFFFADKAKTMVMLEMLFPQNKVTSGSLLSR